MANRQPARWRMADTTKPPEQTAATSTYYDALRETKDRTPVPMLTFSKRYGMVVRSLGRERLIALARYLYDNYGQVSYAVDTIANYSGPLTPQAASPNPAWNKAAMTYWEGWTERADFTGRFTFNQLQRLVCKAIDVDGDIGVTFTDENGFAQVQLIDSWSIAAPRNMSALIWDGVQVDAKGRVTGYYLDTEPAPVPPWQMLLLYDPDRYTSYRGVTPLRRGANDLRDAQDIKGFEKLATKIGSALAAVLEQSGPVEENLWGDDTGPDGNAPSAEATQWEKQLSIADLLGGDIPTLPEGTKLNQLTNTRPGDRVPDWIVFLIASYVMGLGIPPAFFLDEKLTGPNQRAVNGKAQRKFDQRQDDVMAPLLQRTWRNVMADAIARRALPSQEGFDQISWQGPPKLSIDEGRDANEWRQDLQSGLMTRQIHFGQRGLDWKRETDQSFDEDAYIIERCRKLSQETSVPLEVLLTRYGFSGSKPAPAPAPGEEQQVEEGKKEKP